jgi:hypothetical protein
MLCPAQTTVPTATVAVTGSKLLRSPPGCATTSTPRSTTLPAKTTRPALGASTATPGEAARSTPRWPDNQGRAGLSKARTTRTGEISGARGAGRRDRRLHAQQHREQQHDTECTPDPTGHE